MSVSTTTRTYCIDEAVQKVLAAAECDGTQLRLTGQLDRDLYTSTNKVLEALGGRWNRKAKAHVFEGDAAELVDEVLLTGSYSKTKQDFGFFETPAEIVQQLLDGAYIKPGMEVLEPSAGHGAIADAIRSAGAVPTCCELQDKNVLVLAKKQHIVRPGDFLQWNPAVIEDRFDAVVMNPPFSRRADIYHITHAAKFLKPKGYLSAVASASVMMRNDKLARDFRDFVRSHFGMIVELPDGSFKASGTMVRTVLITLENA